MSEWTNHHSLTLVTTSEPTQMNTRSSNSATSFDRVRRLLAAAFALGVLATVSVAAFAPEGLLLAYRFAVFACLAPAVGSMLFLLIYRLTGGHWGEALGPFLRAGTRLAPWIWVLISPLLFFRTDGAPAWPRYDSNGMVTLRAGGYAVVLFWIARSLVRRRAEPAAWVGPVGLIVMVFTLHFLADDWLGGLEPHFHSTAFPLVWMVGLAVTGMACAVLTALASGHSPGVQKGEPRAPGFDWGNLLLAAMLFWTYVAFAQFLIIWSGNLPHEISWYIHRTQGAWLVVPSLLALLHFALPFAVLLSRSFKRSPQMLRSVAALLVLAQLLYIAWVILPVANSSSAWATGALLLTGASAFAYRYLAVVSADTSLA